MNLPTDELEKEIEALLHGIFGNIEVEPGKFEIIPGRHYEVTKPLKQFILQREEKNRKQALEAIERAFYDGIDQGGEDYAGEVFSAKDYLEK